MTTPAGPQGHWLWGCSNQMRNDPMGLYSRAWRDYGDYVRIRAIAGIHFSLLVHPDAIEHVLVKNAKNYHKPPSFLRSFSLLGGNGIFSNESESWLRQRRLMQPAFHRQHLARLAPLIVAATDAFVREREVAGPGQTVDILDEMMRLSLRIASTTLFSSDVSADADAIGQAYRTAFAFVSLRMNTLIPMPMWVPTRRHREFTNAMNLLNRVVLELIEARRRSPDRPNDLLTLLLAAQDEETGGGMTDQQLKDEALTLLTAGHETVGAALSWTWYLLGQHPEVQNNVADEVCGRLQGRSPTADDLAELPLTRAIFEEAMRLYPPAWGVPREAIQAEEINGFPIPAKSVLILSQFLTHRHPAFWSEPDKFQPERFLPGASVNRPKFAYYPFGGGPRVCIGNTFALLEGPLVLATILQQYRVELVPGADHRAGSDVYPEAEAGCQGRSLAATVARCSASTRRR